MAFFDRFRKKEHVPEVADTLTNSQEMLSAKLLFFEKPNVDADKILANLKLSYTNVYNQGNGEALLYFFPEIQVHFTDKSVPAQCTVLIPNKSNEKAEFKDEAFQQNWHWPEANDTATKCKYEIVVCDFMTRPLDYKTRLDLFMNFLVAVTKATNPQVVYPTDSQKFIEPVSLITSWEGENKEILFGLLNIRLYNVSDSETNEVLMDSIGLHLFGLPDVQIKFSDFKEGQIASLLWTYAYYLFEHGDIIKTGNTLMGLQKDSKCKCEKKMSLVAPNRVVLNIQPT